MGEYNPDQMLPVMIMMDPPRHTQLRSLVNRAFTRRRIAEWEESIRVIARDLVEALVDAGGGDFVEDLAKPLAHHRHRRLARRAPRRPQGISPLVRPAYPGQPR